jgi:hypothetical protein
MHLVADSCTILQFSLQAASPENLDTPSYVIYKSFER